MKSSRRSGRRSARSAGAVAQVLERRLLLSDWAEGAVRGDIPDIALFDQMVSAGAGTAEKSALLTLVPRYINSYGGVPTVGGMLLGYWDILGYPNLFEGDASYETVEVRQGIISDLHLRDYAPSPDAATTHADNCIADFMGTSRNPLRTGVTYGEMIDVGLEGYARYRGYEYADATTVTWGTVAQASTIAELDAGRPCLLGVDVSGDGSVDSEVICLGYRTMLGGYTELAIRHAAPAQQSVYWIRPHLPTYGEPLGIGDVTFFHPSLNRADLVPYELELASVLGWGSTFTLGYRIRNYGGRSAAASSVQFYLSSNDIISTLDHKLGETDVPALAVNGLHTNTITLRLPATPPAGFTNPDSAFIGMIVDSADEIAEGSESNNGRLAQPVDISDMPDLTGKSFRLSMPELSLGTTTVYYSIRNVGRADASVFKVRFYETRRSEWGSTTHTQLGEIEIVDGLAAGATYTGSIDLAVPAPGPAISQYSIRMVADVAHQVTEANEDNNQDVGNGIDTAPAMYGTRVFNATFDNGDGALQVQNDTPASLVNGLWHLTTQRSGDAGHGGGTSIYYGRKLQPDYDAGDTAGYFLTKNIQLPEGMVALSFNYFSDVDAGRTTDLMAVDVYDVETGTFKPLLAKGSGLEASTGKQWARAMADLSRFAGDLVRLRFMFDTVNSANNSGEGWYIDDVAIWAMSNGIAADTYRCLDNFNDYRHVFAYLNDPGDHDTFAFCEQTSGGSFELSTAETANISPCIAVYSHDTGEMLFIDGGAGGADQAGFTLANVGSENLYLVEMWDREEDSSGGLDVAIVGTGGMLPLTIPVDTAGHAARSNLEIAARDVDYINITAPASASGRLTITVTPHDDDLLAPRVQVWKNNASDEPDRIVMRYDGPVSTTFTNVLPGDLFRIAVADNDFTDPGQYDILADFELYPSTLPGTAGDDTVYLRCDPTNEAIVQVFVNAPTTGAPTHTLPAAGMAAVTLDLLGGNDSLTVDLRNGPAMPVPGVSFLGGTGTDSIRVIGNDSAGSYQPDGSTTGSGVIQCGRPIQFASVSSILSHGFSEFALTMPRSDDVLIIDSPGRNQNRLSGSSGGLDFTPLTFYDVGKLSLDLATHDAPGNDRITIESPGMVASGLDVLRVNAGIGNNSLVVENGPVTLDTSPGVGGVNLGIIAEGTSHLQFPATQRLKGLALLDTARATMLADGNRVLVTRVLEMAAGAKLDLADNDLIVQATAASRATVAASIFAWVASGRNGASLWNGSGIRSSVAASHSLTGLAAVLNDRGDGNVVMPTFAGEPVDAHSILVKHTYNGDVDLNGKVDAADYFLVDSGYLAQSKGYRNGDLDYSNKVDATDYFLIDSAFLGQAGALAVVQQQVHPGVTQSAKDVTRTVSASSRAKGRQLRQLSSLHQRRRSSATIWSR